MQQASPRRAKPRQIPPSRGLRAMTEGCSCGWARGTWFGTNFYAPRGRVPRAETWRSRRSHVRVLARPSVYCNNTTLVYTDQIYNYGTPRTGTVILTRKRVCRLMTIVAAGLAHDARWVRKGMVPHDAHLAERQRACEGSGRQRRCRRAGGKWRSSAGLPAWPSRMHRQRLDGQRLLQAS